MFHHQPAFSRKKHTFLSGQNLKRKQLSISETSSRGVISARRLQVSCRVLAALAFALVATTTPALGQIGGMGPPGAGGGIAGPSQRPKFRDHIHSLDTLPIGREKGDKVVASVKIVGNRSLSGATIGQRLQTRKGRFYSYETVLADVGRLQDMGSFDHVTFKTQETPQGVAVQFIVHERPLVKEIVLHGTRGMNKRELKGRLGLAVNDPLSEFAIENARRRLIDFYKEKGFNQVAITSTIGLEGKPGTVVYRINEGPLERIESIRVLGNTVLSEARLKKIIKSRGPFMMVGRWVQNVANLNQVDQDVDILAATYHNLGYLTATVGRRLEYDESGKWMTVTYVVNEGPRFRINNIQIEGAQFVKADSLRERLELKSGDMFDGTILRRDIGEMVYGYGELGFIYAEIEPQTIMRDDDNSVDLIYKIAEGDRWKIGEIRVNIEGEPHLMRETVMLNMLDMREGDWINRKFLETARRRVTASQLLETNPQVADPPDIIVEPNDENARGEYR